MVFAVADPGSGKDYAGMESNSFFALDQLIADIVYCGCRTDVGEKERHVCNSQYLDISADQIDKGLMSYLLTWTANYGKGSDVSFAGEVFKPLNFPGFGGSVFARPTNRNAKGVTFVVHHPSSSFKTLPKYQGKELDVLVVKVNLPGSWDKDSLVYNSLRKNCVCHDSRFSSDLVCGRLNDVIYHTHQVLTVEAVSSKDYPLVLQWAKGELDSNMELCSMFDGGMATFAIRNSPLKLLAFVEEVHELFCYSSVGIHADCWNNLQDYSFGGSPFIKVEGKGVAPDGFAYYDVLEDSNANSVRIVRRRLIEDMTREVEAILDKSGKLSTNLVGSEYLASLKYDQKTEELKQSYDKLVAESDSWRFSILDFIDSQLEDTSLSTKRRQELEQEKKAFLEGNFAVTTKLKGEAKVKAMQPDMLEKLRTEFAKQLKAAFHVFEKRVNELSFTKFYGLRNEFAELVYQELGDLNARHFIIDEVCSDLRESYRDFALGQGIGQAAKDEALAGIMELISDKGTSSDLAAALKIQSTGLTSPKLDEIMQFFLAVNKEKGGEFAQSHTIVNGENAIVVTDEKLTHLSVSPRQLQFVMDGLTWVDSFRDFMYSKNSSAVGSKGVSSNLQPIMGSSNYNKGIMTYATASKGDWLESNSLDMLFSGVIHLEMNIKGKISDVYWTQRNISERSIMVPRLLVRETEGGNLICICDFHTGVITCKLIDSDLVTKDMWYVEWNEELDEKYKGEYFALSGTSETSSPVLYPTKQFFDLMLASK